jgi:hypothetical protein
MLCEVSSPYLPAVTLITRLWETRSSGAWLLKFGGRDG